MNAAVSSTSATLELILQEIRINARLAEEQIWELSYQLKAKTEEAARLRLQTTPTSSRNVADSDEVEDATVAAQLAMERKRFEELQAEIQRDRVDKARLVKLVDMLFAGQSPATLSESIHFVAGRKHTAPLKLREMLRTLPTPNVEVLGAGQYFEFALGTLATAIQQIRRRESCDVERIVLSGVSHTGQKLSMNVVLQAISQADFDKM
jgi:hypothetical protein